MKLESLSVILTCARLLLVEGLDTKNQSTAHGSRILNGEIADPADFPYLVNLRPNGQGVCGGSIISNNFILTTAHCMRDVECAAIGIVPSTWAPEDSIGIHALGCYPHNNYPGSGFFCDIGLIETAEDLLVDLNLAKIPLPTPDTNYPAGTAAVIAGWGMDETGYHPNHLKRGNQVIYDWDSCNYDYQNADECSDDGNCPVANIPNRSMCAVGEEENPASGCEGDSGGPVIIDGMIVGVIAGTILKDGKCVVGSPTLYMNVVRFLPWIQFYLDSEGGTRRQAPPDDGDC